MTPLDIYASYVPGDWPETWDEDDNQGRTYGDYSGTIFNLHGEDRTGDLLPA